MNKLKMYSPLHSWKKGERPIDPFVYIEVGTHTSSGTHLFLSPQLMTDTEIDYEVDSLVKELEQIRTAAKSELRTLQAKIRAK